MAGAEWAQGDMRTASSWPKLVKWRVAGDILQLITKAFNGIKFEAVR